MRHNAIYSGLIVLSLCHRGAARPRRFLKQTVAAERAAYYVDLGFTGLKFDPMPNIFDGEHPPVQLSLDWLRKTEETMAAVRGAVGEGFPHPTEGTGARRGTG